MSRLFETLQLGALTLPNRIIMAPLTRSAPGPAGRGARPPLRWHVGRTREGAPLRSGHCCFVSLDFAREFDEQAAGGCEGCDHAPSVLLAKR